MRKGRGKPPTLRDKPGEAVILDSGTPNGSPEAEFRVRRETANMLPPENPD